MRSASPRPTRPSSWSRTCARSSSAAAAAIRCSQTRPSCATRSTSQVDELRTGGLDATFVVRTCTSGHAAGTIAEIAGEVGADLIVVGTHGYGRVAGMLLGSVTQGLLHKGICPVLAIPTGVPAERERELATTATA